MIFSDVSQTARLWARVSALVACVLMCADAEAWGPRSRAAIISSAARVVTQDVNIPLTRLHADIVRGSQVEGEEFTRLIPLATANPLAAIEAEMYLLQAAKGDRVDPYLAYRLGVLGRMVADATAPLSNTRSPYRSNYYADADAAVDRISIRTRPRRTVDPDTFFAEVARAANVNADLMVKDYETGLGFNGIARGALGDDINRSVDAVADVWYTVLSGSALVANISETQLRDFAVDALEFYVKRGNSAEADATYNKLMGMGIQTVELRSRIGDMYYEAGEFDRAVAEYTAVLEADPGRKDIATKLANHFVGVGDKAMDEKRLELALEAYEKAANVDKLHADAQVRVVQARNAITQRNQRMSETELLINEGQELSSSAEQEVRRNNYARALELLTQADTKYAAVTAEFPELSRAAASARTSLSSRMQQIRDELRNNSALLSGSGSSMGIAQLASDAAKASATEAMKSLITAQYQAGALAMSEEILRELTAGER